MMQYLGAIEDRANDIVASYASSSYQQVFNDTVVVCNIILSIEIIRLWR